ncbi:MAG: divalent cation tolerance protein CutA [Candidatus Aegiribacteria sp.]|nr:divalent cation tolerance protein CutA [Candidatus Aegiribacteria sp.]
MNEVPVVQITTTVNSEEEACRIAEAAVSRKLAACAQVTGPIISYYYWKGEQCREKEWRVSMKTLKNLELNLMDFINEDHPYETPELITMRIETVSEAYLEWMLQTLGD